MGYLKHIAAILLCVLLICGMAPSAAAGGKMKVSVGSVTAEVGETIKIPVSVNNNLGIIGFYFSISYDPNLITYVSYEKGTIVHGDLKITSGGTGKLATIYASYGMPKQVSLDENQNQIIKNGNLFYLVFKITGKRTQDTQMQMNLKLNIFYQTVTKLLVRTPLLQIPTENGTITVKAFSPSKTETKISMFSDLTGDYESITEYVEYLAEKGIIGGVGNGKFAPENNVKRGDFVKMLAGVSGVDFSGDTFLNDKFIDVLLTHSYNKLIGWAAGAGIVTGYGDKTFKMDNNITREEMVVMVCRLAKYMNVTLSTKVEAIKLEDEAEISGYAKEAVLTLQKAGIVYESMYFSPKDLATRADAAKTLALYMKAIDAQ